jgi:tetratricopeptide (TPR) repeat protein
VSSTPPGKTAPTVFDLARTSVARLLFALLHRRFTGTVGIDQGGSRRRTIWIRGGMPVFTDWAPGDGPVHDVLVESGPVTVEDVVDALAAGDRPLSAALGERGVAESASTIERVREQCARRLVDLLGLRRGTAIVTQSVGLDPSQDQRWQINVLAVIHRGVSRHYDEARVLAELDATASGRVVAAPAFERYRNHFGFRADDGAILGVLARGTHFQALLGLPGMDRKRAAQVAYTLWACQMLSTSTGEPRAADAAPSRTVHAASAPPAAAKRPPPPPGPPPPPPRPGAAGSSTSTPPPTPGVPSAAPPPPTPGFPSTDPPSTPAPDEQSAQARPPAKPASAPEKAAAAEGPAPPRAAEGTGEFETALSEMEQKIADGAHAFALLGVPLDATKRDVRRAFSDMSRAFHPDALKAKGLDHLRDRVEHVFAALSEAQLVLGDPKQREQLKQLIESGKDPREPQVDAGALARAALESEVLAREADKLLGAGKFERALTKYEAAVALNPDELDFHAAIHWCRYNLSGKTDGDTRQTLAALEEIAENAPNLARVHYFRGLLLLRLGRDDVALVAFSAALEANPRLVDAERQIRAARARRSAAAQKKGGKKKPGFRGR